jgi:hypothetical protein
MPKDKSNPVKCFLLILLIIFQIVFFFSCGIPGVSKPINVVASDIIDELI